MNRNMSNSVPCPSASPSAAESAPLRFDLLRGAAVVSMATIGNVYGLLVSGYQEALQTTIPWVDTVVHRVMPLAVVAD